MTGGYVWLVFLGAACLVALVASAVLIAIASYLGCRALGELRAIARGAASADCSEPGFYGPCTGACQQQYGAGPLQEAATETLPSVYPPGTMPLDARPVAARVRPYLWPRAGKHGGR